MKFNLGPDDFGLVGDIRKALAGPPAEELIKKTKRTTR
jgi:hypothetical protein